MNKVGTNTRRRGDTLTEDIYKATIELIKKVGYTNLTFQQIAQAAKTSRTVLYRRWKTTFELIYDIMVYKMKNTLGEGILSKFYGYTMGCDRICPSFRNCRTLFWVDDAKI